jgi:hypothetical protein
MLGEHLVHHGGEGGRVGHLGEPLARHDGVGALARAVHLLEHVLGHLAADGARVQEAEQPREVAGGDGTGGDRYGIGAAGAAGV